MSNYVQQVGGSIILLLNIFVYQQNCLDNWISKFVLPLENIKLIVSLAITNCTAERCMSWPLCIVKKLKEQIACNDA